VSRAAEVFRRAALAFQVGDMERAESLCRKARKLVPEFHGSSYMLGVLLTRRGAPQEAATEFVRAAKLAPRDVASHYEAGRVLMGCGRLPEAIARHCAVQRAHDQSRRLVDGRPGRDARR